MLAHLRWGGYRQTQKQSLQEHAGVTSHTHLPDPSLAGLHEFAGPGIAEGETRKRHPEGEATR